MVIFGILGPVRLIYIRARKSKSYFLIQPFSGVTGTILVSLGNNLSLSAPTNDEYAIIRTNKVQEGKILFYNHDSELF